MGKPNANSITYRSTNGAVFKLFSKIEAFYGEYERIKTREELLELYPDTIAIIDTTEQPVEKSKDKEERKGHYSGKKRRTTLKTQILINGKKKIICILLLLS